MKLKPWREASYQEVRAERFEADEQGVRVTYRYPQTDATWEVNYRIHANGIIRVDNTFEALDKEVEMIPRVGMRMQLNNRHFTDLKAEPLVDFFLDYRMMGVGGDNSWGYTALEKYLIRPGQENRVKYGFTLVPFDKKSDYKKLIRKY